MVRLGNMTAKDYPISFPFGATSAPYSPASPHKGEDRAMPQGTPIVVNGVQIGISGTTGNSTGPHLHIGKFTQNGTLMPPLGQGFSFNSARVITVASDATNGNYVRLLADGYCYVYLHMLRQTCAVGDVLNAPAPQPVAAPSIPIEQQGEDMITDADNNYSRWSKLGYQIRGRNLTRQEFQTYAVGRTWLSAMEILSDSPEADAATSAPGQLQSQVAELQATTNQLNKQVADLTALDNQDKAALQDALNKLNVQSARLTQSAVPKPIPQVVATKPVADYSWLTKLVAKLPWMSK